MTRGSGRGELPGDLPAGGGDGLGAGLLAIGQAFGANHFDIGDAEETQHGAQVAFVGRAGRLAGMHATGGGDDHHFLVAGQANRAVLGVAEGLAGDRDAIDPGLELAGDGEVVHRRADYHDVGGEELFQHFFTHRDFMLQRGIAQLRRGAAGGQGQGGEMRHRVGGQVAVGDVKPVFVLPPGLETGIPKSRLSRRIAELEERLQVRLLHRTTRKLALTEVGERYLQHCRNLLLEAEMAEQVIAELSVEPRGRLRLSAPVAMASSNLADLLPRFLERHPQVQLEILLTNRRVDLLNEGVDVALRVRELGDEDPALVCRRLAPATTQILAAPSLIAGRHLEHPEDLEDLPFLGAIHNDRKVHATLIGPDGSRYQLEREPRLGVDDFVLRKKAAVAGLGVTLLPEGYCDRELADGSLVRILPQWTLPKSTMQAAYLPRSSQIPAIRALIDFLVEALQRPSGETGPAYRRARE